MICDCGLNYDDFRTGLRYRDVFEMLWVPDNSPQKWKQKRRHSVLGKWHEIKQKMWSQHKKFCER